MILAAGNEGTLARPALERLCRKYWWPLFGFARRAGLSHEAGEDAVQTYLLTVIERGSLHGVLSAAEAYDRQWAQTVASPAELEDELRYLFNIAGSR